MGGGGGLDQARFETRRLDGGGLEIRVRQDGYCDSPRDPEYYSEFGYLTPWVAFEDGDVSAETLARLEDRLFPYLEVARSFRNGYYENKVEEVAMQTTCGRPDCSNKAWFSALTHEPLLCPAHTKRVFTEVPDDRR